VISWTRTSYSRVNKDFALRLAKELKLEGFNVWLDQLDIPAGSRWDREVEKALKECEIFMIILTPASINSENVLDEIGYTIDKGKRILPVLLENCDVPLRLRRFQYVDFTTKSFEDGVESAKELLKAFIDETSKPVLAITPSINYQTASASAISANKQGTPVSTVKISQKSTSKGLIIGIVAVVVLVIAGIVFNVLSMGRSNSTVTEVPIIALVTEVPATKSPIPATEPPTAIIPNSNFEDGCIDSTKWSLLDGDSRNADNNCWLLSDWGMNAENGKGLVVVTKNPKAAVSHGILISINQPVTISFDVQINEMSTPSLLDSYMGFGFLPANTSVPKTDGMLYYLVVDKQNAPIYI
jgi:hypothetical protein